MYSVRARKESSGRVFPLRKIVVRYYVGSGDDEECIAYKRMFGGLFLRLRLKMKARRLMRLAQKLLDFDDYYSGA